MYNYIIVTHIPNFYKVNLYNELSKNLKILVLFTARSTSEKRSDDFITLDKSEFEYDYFMTETMRREMYYQT